MVMIMMSHAIVVIGPMFHPYMLMMSHPEPAIRLVLKKSMKSHQANTSIMEVSYPFFCYTKCIASIAY